MECRVFFKVLKDVDWARRVLVELARSAEAVVVDGFNYTKAAATLTR